MHYLESVLENETPKILKDFEIQINRLIQARRQDLVIVKKMKIENLPTLPFGQAKNKIKRKRKKRQLPRSC